jgi:hypothetical protein
MLPKQEKRRVSRQEAWVTHWSRAGHESDGLRLHTAPQNEKFQVYNSPLFHTILIFVFRASVFIACLY